MKKNQNNALLTAINLFTRLPVRHCDTENTHNCLGWFPLVGWLVVLLASLVVYTLSFSLPVSLAVLGAIFANLWLTGALHEDGLADYFDSLGAKSKEQALNIMQDSRLGSYGVLGLVGFLAWRFLAWFELWQQGFSVFFGVVTVAQSTSRWVVVYVVQNSQHVRQASHFAWLQPLTTKHYALAFIIGLLPFLLLPLVYLWLLLPLLLWQAWLVKHFNRTLGGYTGDCLGLSQTLTEALLYAGWFLLPTLFELVANNIAMNHINNILCYVG